MILRDYLLNIPSPGNLILRGAEVPPTPTLRVGGGGGRLRRLEDVFPDPFPKKARKPLTDAEVVALLSALGYV